MLKGWTNASVNLNMPTFNYFVIQALSLNIALASV